MAKKVGGLSHNAIKIDQQDEDMQLRSSAEYSDNFIATDAQAAAKTPANQLRSSAEYSLDFQQEEEGKARANEMALRQDLEDDDEILQS